MDAPQAVVIGLGLATALAASTVVLLRGSFQRLLFDLCGSETHGRFWLALACLAIWSRVAGDRVPAGGEVLFRQRQQAPGADDAVGGNAAGAQQQNAGFDARLNNLVMYRSPVFKGFSGEFAYGANEQKSNTTAAAQIDPEVWSLLARYEMGPWFASYAHERRKDVFGLNSLTTIVPGTGVTGALFAPPAGASSTDTGNKLGLGYSFRDTDVLFVWENLKYKTNAGAVSAYGRDAWVASVSHRFGPHRAIASYGRAGPGSCTLAAGGSCSTAGLGAKQWGVGYDYTLDSTTSLYAFWSRITNDSAAAYNFGISGAPAAGVGTDPEALALGIRYKF